MDSSHGLDQCSKKIIKNKNKKITVLGLALELHTLWPLLRLQALLLLCLSLSLFLLFLLNHLLLLLSLSLSFFLLFVVSPFLRIFLLSGLLNVILLGVSQLIFSWALIYCDPLNIFLDFDFVRLDFK